MIEYIYNFLQLSENIATSGQPTDEQFTTIAQEGYEVVINLGLIGTKYALEDEAGLIRDLGIKYIQIPVVWEEPKRENFELFVSVMEENQGNKVFVHCAANMRVSVFMALYRILQLGWEHKLAFAEVYKIWEPNDTWKAFVKLMLNQEG